MKRVLSCLFVLACSIPLFPVDITVLREWKAGSYVTQEMVDAFGEDNCFGKSEISDVLFARMKGKSYKDYCTLPLDSLRYIRTLHKTVEGRIRLGEMVVNHALADELVEIFRKLYDAGYPIELMVLVDEYDADDKASMRANNSSAFNCRTIGGGTVPSKHSLGCAVDINPLYNPYCKVRDDGSLMVQPATAVGYVDRTKNFVYKITEGDICVRLFRSKGYKWGGNWANRKDYQHFEKSGAG